jgi:hypothetical protein
MTRGRRRLLQTFAAAAQDDEDWLRAGERAYRFEADVLADGKAIAALSFGDAEGGERHAEQVEAEQLHALLLRARGAMRDRIMDRYDEADPVRARWRNAPRAVPRRDPSPNAAALDAYQAGLRTIRTHDRRILDLVQRWGRRHRREYWPLFLNRELVVYMRDVVALYTADGAVVDDAPPRLEGRVGWTVPALGRAASAAQKRDARAADLGTRLARAIRESPGSAAAKLEKALGVTKRGSLSKLLNELTNRGAIVNRGSAVRPRYYIVDNV